MPSLARLQLLAVLSLLVAATLCVSPRALAIVVVPTDGLEHAVSPPSGFDPGWANVSNRGVYLGNRWMITARHVGEGDTVFADRGTFSYEPGTRVELINSGSLEHFADLILYRLAADPNLPSLTIASATPPVGGEVTLIGAGLGVVGGAETHWSRTLEPSPDPPHYSYTETDQTNGQFHGYKSIGSAARWGTNMVEDDEAIGNENDADHTLPVDAFPGDFNYGETIAFTTKFDKPEYTTGPATASEAQAQTGDSGSGVFFKVGADWRLAGITIAVDLEIDQPSGSATAFYGNRTYIADLATYRDQILSVVGVPEVGSFALVGAAASLAACGPTIRRSRRIRGALGHRA